MKKRFPFLPPAGPALPGGFSILLTLIMVPFAQGQVLNYDVTSGTPGAQDGAGVWNANSTANWWNGTADVVWPTAASATTTDAVFGTGGTGGGTVTVTTVSVNDITFGASNYLLTGSTITLVGLTPTISTSASAEIASILAGSAGMVKTGNATLTLSGANSYTGTTTISAGTLQIGNGGTTGALTSASIINNSALTFNRSNALSYTGIISGSGSLTQSGSGTTTLSGANTYSGNTLITGGTLTAGGASGAGTGAFGNNSAVTVSSPGTLALSTFSNTIGSLSGNGAVTFSSGTLTTGGNNFSTTYSGNITGTSGGLTKTGSGTMTLSGSNAYNGATSVGNGTLRAGSTTALSGSSAMSVAAGTTLDLNDFNNSVGSLAGAGNITLGSATLTTGGANTSTSFSGILSETGSLIKTGSGTQTLSGANTYEGSTAVTAGVLNLQNGSALGSILGGTSVSSGAALELQSGITITGEALSLSGSGISSSGALRSVSGTNTFSGPITLAAASEIQADAGTLNLSGGISGTNTALTIETAGASTATNISGSIATGTGGLTKSGAGTLTLSAASTYTGATTISAGTLTLGADNILADTTDVSVASGATFNVNGHTDTIASLAGAGAVTLSSGSNLTTGADNTSTTYSGAASGAGTLTKIGSGTLTLSGNNPIGDLVVGTANGPSGGIVSVAGLSATTDVTIYAGQTLNTAGSLQINNLTLGGGASGTTADFRVNNIGSTYIGVHGNITYDATNNPGGAIISGDAGNPHLDLLASNTLITVGDSTATDSSLGTYDLTLAAYVGNLANGSSANTVTKLGPGSLFLKVNGTFTGGLVNYTGTFTIGSSGGSDAGSVVFGDNQGIGTNAMKGLNLYGGLMDMKGFTQTVGYLNLGGGDSSSTSRIDVGSGGVLTLAGNVTYDASNNPNGATVSNGTLALGAAARTFNIADSTAAAADLTVASVISGSVGITKTGAGNLLFTGTNTYTGTTTVSVGSLQVGDADAGTTGTGAAKVSSGTTGTGAVSVASGATIFGTGTVKGNFSAASGSTVQAGDSTATNDLGILSFNTGTAGATYNFLAGSNTVLGITTTASSDPTYGGTTLGTPAYNSWVGTRNVAGNGTADLLNVGAATTSTFTLSGNITVTASGYTPKQGDVFDIMNWGAGVTTAFGGFSTGTNYRDGSGDNGSQFDLPDISASGYKWDVSNFLTTGKIVVVVPEPGSVLLTALGLAGLLRRRRRRQASARQA